MLKELVIAGTMMMAPSDSTLESRLVERGYSQEAVHETFSQHTPQQSIIPLFESNPEKKGEEGEMSYQEYKENLEFEYRSNLLPRFIENHENTLQDAEEVFGVDYRYIASIIGTETGFGTYTGSYSVSDVYKTIHENIEDKRSFALEQAECLVNLVESDKLSEDMEGSYAGALGYGQFIPCSVQDYFMGDIDSMEDTIYSVANYLRNNHKEHEDMDGYTRWDPSRNGEEITVGEGNYFAIWSYNHNEFYTRFIDELARSVER